MICGLIWQHLIMIKIIRRIIRIIIIAIMIMIMILVVVNFGFQTYQTYQTGSSVFECRENKPSVES